MTIASVSTHALSLPFEMGGPKPSFAGRPRQMEMLLVRVETADGVVGWGEAFGFAVWPSTRVALETLVAPLAVGGDETEPPALVGELARRLHLLGRTGPVMYALSGLDIALWDIAGKRAGKPVAALLGGPKRTDLACYASLLRYGDAPLVAANAQRAVAAGYRAVKLHEVRLDEARAAREAVGHQVRLMLDCNCPWSPGEAIDVAKALHPLGLHWLEEPVYPPEDYKALARVRKEGGVRIAAGENATSYHDFRRMFELGAVDYAQPSATKIGGITELARIGNLCEASGVSFQPHSPYVGPGLLATLHVAAAMQKETLIEVSWCDLGANPLGDAITPVQGRLRVPGGPGLGRDPDPEVLARCAV